MRKLLFVSIGLLLWVPTSSAQMPISQYYVPQILQRADAGLAKASNDTPASNFLFLFFSWLDDLQAVIVGSIDTENRIVLHEQNLSQITPCLHHDLLLIEAKINQVHDALTRAITEKRVHDIWILKELAHWLNGRYNYLVNGATNPNLVDTQFSWRYSFDPVAWCCIEPYEDFVCTQMLRTECIANNGLLFGGPNECGQVCVRSNPENDPAPICPFDTNYLPPTEAGYGCDATALDAIGSSTESITLEKAALLEFEMRKQAFLQEHASMIETGDALLESAGRTPINLPLQAEAERQHQRISGCAPDVQNTQQPTGRLPDGAARIALRSPFSFEPEQIRISVLVEDILRRLGSTREQEDVLKIPSEFPEGSTERSEAMAREENMTLLQKAARTLLRLFFQSVNEESAGKEAAPLLQSIDAQHRVESSFAQLREPTKQLAEFASVNGSGVRQFVSNYANFMLRACVFRPCNTLLYRVLSIVLDDSCFPYTNGEFLNPDWEPSNCAPAE